MFRLFRRYGFGIQSPWAYDLTRNVLYEHLRYYAYDDLRRQYPHVSRRQRKQNEQLFRIVLRMKPTKVLVEGNCDESTLAYISAAGASVVRDYPSLVLVGDSQKKASREVDTLDEKKSIPTASKVPFIYLAPHAGNQLPLRFDTDSVVVIDDINGSNRHLYKAIMLHPDSRVIFRLPRRALLFFDPKRAKQTYRF